MDFFPGFFPFCFFGPWLTSTGFRSRCWTGCPNFGILCWRCLCLQHAKPWHWGAAVGSWNLEVSIGDRFAPKGIFHDIVPIPKSVRAGFLKPRILKNHEVSLMMRLILLLWMLVFRHFHVFRLEDPPPSLANFQGNSNQPFKSTPWNEQQRRKALKRGRNGGFP